MTNKNYQSNDSEFYAKVLSSLNAVANSDSSIKSKKELIGLIDDIVMNYEEHKSLMQKMILSNFDRNLSEKDRTYN